MYFNIFCRTKPHTENILGSSSAQSSPSRNLVDTEVVSTAIPVAIIGRQPHASRSTRTLNFNSPSPIGLSAIPASGAVPQQLQSGSRQTVYNNGQHLGTQSNMQISSSANIPLPISGTHGGGAIPRRNIRRGNSATEEEQCGEKP